MYTLYIWETAILELIIQCTFLEFFVKFGLSGKLLITPVVFVYLYSKELRECLKFTKRKT